MIPKQNTIFVYDTLPGGRVIGVPIEETPDDLSFLTPEQTTAETPTSMTPPTPSQIPASPQPTPVISQPVAPQSTPVSIGSTPIPITSSTTAGNPTQNISSTPRPNSVQRPNTSQNTQFTPPVNTRNQPPTIPTGTQPRYTQQSNWTPRPPVMNRQPSSGMPRQSPSLPQQRTTGYIQPRSQDRQPMNQSRPNTQSYAPRPYRPMTQMNQNPLPNRQPAVFRPPQMPYRPLQTPNQPTQYSSPQSSSQPTPTAEPTTLPVKQPPVTPASTVLPIPPAIAPDRTPVIPPSNVPVGAIEEARRHIREAAAHEPTSEQAPQIFASTQSMTSPTVPHIVPSTTPEKPQADPFVPSFIKQTILSGQQVQPTPKRSFLNWKKALGIGLVIISIGGLSLPYIQKTRLEATYRVGEVKNQVSQLVKPQAPLPPAVPKILEPLKNPDGSVITPVNTEFSLIIPKIGVNAPIIANVNPADTTLYNEELKKGVAHAVTSFTPDKNGTTYLFSHSTSYQWFVKDLNAIFYLVKNLEAGDSIVVYYKNVRYTYILKNRRVVKPNSVGYLVPQDGQKSLILQTCWPPGSTTERLLLFADFVEEQGEQV